MGLQHAREFNDYSVYVKGLGTTSQYHDSKELAEHSIQKKSQGELVEKKGMPVPSQRH